MERIIVGQALVVNLHHDKRGPRNGMKRMIVDNKKGWYDGNNLTERESTIIFSKKFYLTINLTQEDWDVIEENKANGIFTGYSKLAETPHYKNIFYEIDEEEAYKGFV